MRLLLLVSIILYVTHLNAQTLSSTGKMNIARVNHKSVEIDANRILVTGGQDAGLISGDMWIPQAYSSTELYNATTKTWTMSYPMKSIRESHSIEKITPTTSLIIGGTNIDTAELRSCEILNLTTLLFSYTGSLNIGRSQHSSIVLNSGKILVAGGSSTSNTCEIFDPATGQWTLAGSLNKKRVSGSSMVMLGDGRVLITGGCEHFNVGPRDGNDDAEIYDPVTDSWTLLESKMSSERKSHRSIMLQDGKVLVVGGYKKTDIDYVLKCDYFDPSTSTFSEAPSLSVTRSSCDLIRLANGDILVFGLGDFSIPSDTKCIEVFSNQTKTWIPTKISLYGSQGYTINKIGTTGDKILVSGGILGGATDLCYIITIPTCGTVTINNVNTGSSVCVGLDATVKIKNSDFNLKYQAYGGSIPFTSPINGNGNELTITIPASKLIAGLNTITLKASGLNAACPFLDMSDTAGIFVTQEPLIAPTIAALGNTDICSSSFVTLSSSSGYPTYVWSNGRTIQSTTTNISTPGTYTVKGKNANGCLSPSSAAITVNYISNTVYAGTEDTVCITKTPYQLTGYSPAGGVWSGTGVSASGVFNASTAGEGTIVLTYTSCGRTSTKNIIVIAVPQLGLFSFTPSPSVSCASRSIAHRVDNANRDYTYQLRAETTDLVPPQKNPYPFFATHYDKTTIVNIRESITNTCGSFEFIVYDTVKIISEPMPHTVFSNADTICLQDTVIFKIVNSSPDLLYGFNSTSSTNSILGNGDTLMLKSPIYNEQTTVYKIYAQPQNLCPIREVFAKEITGFKLKVDFSINQSAYYLDNHQVQIQNKSNGDKFQWTFDNTASIGNTTLENPPIHQYSSYGTKPIKLVSSRFGCADSVTRYPIVCAKASSSSGGVCMLDTITRQYNKKYVYNAYGQQAKNTAIHIDNNNNTYIAGYERVTYSYYTVDLMYIEKYDAAGNLLWKHKQDWLDYPSMFDKYRSSYISSIATDDNGNIYIGGNFGASVFKFGSLITETRNGTAVESFVIKINSSGNGDWMIYTSNVDEDGYWRIPKGVSDILYVDDSHIYISFVNPKVTKFPDGAIVDFVGEKLVIAQIDKDGHYLKSFQASTVSGLIPTNTSTLNNYNYTAVSPKLKLSTDGKIFVGGSFNDVLNIGGQYLYKLGNKYTTNFIGILNTSTGWEKAFVTHASNRSKEIIDFDFTLDENNNVYIPYDYGLASNGYLYPNGSSDNRIALPNEIFLGDSSGSVLMKYDQQGNLVWYNHSTHCYTRNIVYTNNQLITYGEFYNGYFGVFSQSETPKLVQSKGKSDLFLSSTSVNGDLQWLEQLSSNQNDIAYRMSQNNCGELVLHGSFEGRGGIKGDSIYYGNKNPFLARFSLNNNCTTTCNNIPTPLKVSISTLKEQKEINFSPIPLKFLFNRDVTGFDITDVSVTGGILSGFTGSGKLYTAILTPTLNESKVTASIASNSATDGISTNIASNLFEMYFEQTTPSVTISASGGAYNNAATFPLTVTFSEDVIGFTQADFVLKNCKITSMTNAGFTGKSFVATIRPLAEGEFTIEIPDGIAIDSADNFNSASNIISKKHDITRPTVIITTTSPSYTINSPIELSFTFSEYISNFSASKVYAAGFAISNVIGDGISFTATATPLNYANGIVYIGSFEHATDSSGNDTRLSNRLDFIIDKIKPTVVISSSVSNTTSLTSIPYTLTFSEKVYGLTASDILVTNGTITSISGSDSMYQIEVTPLTSGVVSVQLLDGTIQDFVGNLNTSSAVKTVTYDNQKPTVVVSSGVLNPTPATNFIVTITFNEVVSGFSIDDISVTNGTLSNFSGFETSYTVRVTPTNAGIVLVNIKDDVAYDASQNGNLASNNFTINFDNKKPTVAIVSPYQVSTTNSSIPITIIFSEEVTGFTISDISVNNGTISNFSGSGSFYTVDVEAIALGNVYMYISASSALDLASNGNISTSYSILYTIPDVIKPTITITSTAVDPSYNSTIPITITFSETVVGFNANDLVLTNATLSSFSGSGLIYTANIIASTEGLVSVEINDDALTDIAGNTNNHTSFNITYTVDIIPPTVNIVTIQNTNTYPIPVYFYFNENITGFTSSDITVTNATVSGFSGSGNTYSAFISPVSEGIVTVKVDENMFFDLSSNGNLVSNLASVNYDITKPSAIISTGISNPTNTKTFTITINFTEPVIGFSLSSLISSNANFSNLVGSNSTYTVEVTAIAEGSVSIDLISSSILDKAGNESFNNESLIILYQENSTSTYSAYSNQQLYMYPNPSNGWITISPSIMMNHSPFEIIVTDVSGLIVYKKSYLDTNENIILNLTNLKNGAYIMSVKKENNSSNSMIYIQH